MDVIRYADNTVIRVPFFQELLKEYSKIKYQQEDRDIKRDASNPMLRYTAEVGRKGDDE